MYIYIYIYIYMDACVYILRRIFLKKIKVYLYKRVYKYHTMTDVYTAALLPTKPSSDDDSGFRHGFRAEASLPLIQSARAIIHDNTRLCWIDVTLWDCHIHADAVRALSWIFTMYFLLSDGESPILLKNIWMHVCIYWDGFSWKYKWKSLKRNRLTIQK